MDLDSDDVFITKIDPALVTEELHMLVRNGRMRSYWQLPPEEAFDLMGVAQDLADHERAKIAWYGPLELWRKPEDEVSDILFNGPAADPFFIVQRGTMVNTGVRVHPKWLRWVRRQLLLRSGKISLFDNDEPDYVMVQGVADGMRYAITRPPVTPHGISLAVRLLPERWRTLDDLGEAGMMSRAAVDFLLEALTCGASLLISGTTGSGKTTLAAALTQTIGRNRRLVIIEDGGELPRSLNSLHVDVPDEAGAFSQAVRFALRQKPEHIVVGEVRGGEAMALLQAAATGHPGVGTIHAGTVQGALRNLERMAMLGLSAEVGGGQAAAQIVRSLITSDVVNLIIVQIGQTTNGERVVLAIDEVLRQGSQGQSGEHFPTNPLFQYDPTSATLVRVGHVNAAWGLGRL